MFRPLKFLHLFAFAAILSTNFISAAAPVNDNQMPPFLGVYRWGLTGMGRGYYDDYAAWLNRSTTWAVDFQPTDSWDNIEGGIWQLRPWRDWIHAKPGRRLILSVVILPSGWKGPVRGIDAGIPVSLEEGAKGTYNKHFKKLAENLVKYQLGDTILRLGWEFNGGWYSYRAVKKEALFAEYWRQIVQTMRSVSGAENLRYCWNPTNNFVQTDARKCWPGDDYVDYIGVDVYDQSWLPETYPAPDGASPEEIEKRRDLAWNGWNWDKQRHGLAMWRDFAKEHGKPLVIPEWGVCSRKDGHGGNDNPAFVEKMHQFIQDPANNVYFHCYFDVNAGDGHHQLITAGNSPTEFPLSATRFKELFSLPPTPSAIPPMSTQITPAPAPAQTAATPEKPPTNVSSSTEPLPASSLPSSEATSEASQPGTPPSPKPAEPTSSAPGGNHNTVMLVLLTLFGILLLSYFIVKPGRR